MRLTFFITVVFLLISSCSETDCGLHEFNIMNKEFSSETWNELNIDQCPYYIINEDSLNLYYKVLDEREKMLCDIINNKIKPGDSYEKIEKILGPGCTRCNIEGCRILPTHSFSSSKINDAFFKSIYRVGRNASGSCYFVLVFDEKRKYWEHYRAVAQ